VVSNASADAAETASSRSRLSGPHVALILVCIAHGLSPLLLRGAHAGYGWDETVYISQIEPHVPASIFTAPRARGLTLLTAPASYLSASIVVMRGWLAILSAAGMFLAFAPWLRIRRGYVVPVAAGLFSTLWVAIYYSYEAMPNQYVGYGALAAVGWLLAGLSKAGRRRDLAYCAVAIGFTALVRPTDALFLVVAMLAVVGLRSGRSGRARLVTGSVLALGYLAGISEWVVESYVSYGGPIQRFTAASKENTGGLHWALGAEFHTAGGPTLCRTPCVPGSAVVPGLWWFALVPLVIVGLVAARRNGRLLMHGLATAAALALAAQYLVFIAYPAPRFLEPSYALLSLPVAEGLLFLGSRVAPVAKPVAVTATVAVLAVAEVPQLHALHRASRLAQAQWAQDAAVARYLHDEGVSGYCYIGGVQQGEISFAAACRDIPGKGRAVEQVLAQTDAAVALISRQPRARDALYESAPATVAPTPVSVNGLWITILRRRPGTIPPSLQTRHGPSYVLRHGSA
jgi:hypothetical protein